MTRSVRISARAAGPACPVRLLEGLRRVETAVAGGCLALMTAVVFADVMGREIWETGILGAQKLGVYAFVYAGFLGLPLATGPGVHLRPRFADGLARAVPARLMARLQNGVAALLSLALSWVALSFALETRALGETSLALPIPVWLVQIVLPYAFLSSGLRHALFALFPALTPTETGEAF